jgi:hypothetical protein
MTTPFKPVNSQGKDKYFQKQKDTIFLYLKNNVATASMISKATGISQKNICRYKRDLEKAGTLWEVKKALCAITGFKAWYLTTNAKLVRNNGEGGSNAV